jgi:hypothetical protein
MKLIDYLKINKISRRKFQMALGLAHPSLYRIVEGTLSPDAETIAKIQVLTNGEVTVFDYVDEKQILDACNKIGDELAHFEAFHHSMIRFQKYLNNITKQRQATPQPKNIF